jgi:hypothetical protein
MMWVPSITVRAKATWRDRTSSFQYLSGDTLSLVEWPTELVYNTGITLRPGKDNRLSIDLDCRNITDARRSLLSPNTNATTPFALNGREYRRGTHLQIRSMSRVRSFRPALSCSLLGMGNPAQT